MGNQDCSLILIGALIALAAFCAPLAAQSELERFERQLEQIRRETLLLVDQDLPLDQRMLLDYGGYFTFSYLSLDDNLQHNHALRQYDLILYTRLNIDGAHELFLRGRGGWRDFREGDSFDGRGDERIDPDLDRGYYRFDLQRHVAAYHGRRIDNNLVVQGGRDLVYWGNGLTLSQVIDGVKAAVSVGPMSLDVIAGVTPVRTVDFEASRPSFDHNTRRGFYGAMLGTQVGKHRPYIYGLVQRDYNDDEVFALGPVTTQFEYDSHYIGIGSSGALGDRLIYGVELVYQGGTSLSNSFVVSPPFLVPVPQTREDIQAWAASARLDYLLADERRTRLSGELIVASGDDDRFHTSNTFGGNLSGTDDNAFNAFGLLNTGLAFAPNTSNLLAVRSGASTFPFTDNALLRRLQIGFDFFVFAKTERDAPIDERTADERFLGVEPDLFLNWQLTSDVTLAVRYGVFFPNGNAFVETDDRHFVYVGLTYGF